MPYDVSMLTEQKIRKLRCPMCKSEEGFIIVSKGFAVFDKNGKFVDNYTEPKFASYSACTCIECDYMQEAAYFNPRYQKEDGDETNHEQD